MLWLMRLHTSRTCVPSYDVAYYCLSRLQEGQSKHETPDARSLHMVSTRCFFCLLVPSTNGAALTCIG